MPVAVRAEGQRRRGPCGGGVARAEAARRAWRRRGACGVLKRSGAEQRRLRRPGRPDPNRRAGGASCACHAMADAKAVSRIRAPAPERRALGSAGPAGPDSRAGRAMDSGVARGGFGRGTRGAGPTRSRSSLCRPGLAGSYCPPARSGSGGGGGGGVVQAAELPKATTATLKPEEAAASRCREPR